MSHILDRGTDFAIKKLENPERIARHDPNNLLPKAGLSSGMCLADLGCGTGFFSIPAARLVGDSGTVFAVDRVGDILEVLKEKIAKFEINNIQVMESDVTSTPIPNEAVDMVLMANVFHDVDKHTTLKEVHRILRKSGKLFIIDWKKIDTIDGPPTKFRLTPDEASGILVSGGWRVLTNFEAGPAHYALIATHE